MSIKNHKLATLKKLPAILFLFIYLFSTTEMYQLLKAPFLIEHFAEHKEENRQLNIWQFLHIHYAAENAKNADEKDMKLPFKTHDNCVSSISNIYLPVESLAIQKHIPFLEKKQYKSKDHFIPQSFLSNIWQPPRIS